MRPFKGTNLAQASRIEPRFSVRTLVFASVLVLIGLLYANIQIKQAGHKAEQATPTPEVTVAKPVLIPGLFEGVLDSTPEQRVRLERQELEVLKASARQLVEAHFELPEARELTLAVAAELNEQADAQRGALISARGRLTQLVERPGALSGTESEWFGSAVTEEGLPFHFVAIENQAEGSLVPGDWLRLEGLFIKRFSSEAPQGGQFVDGPLLVGRTLQRSFEGLGPVPSLEPALLRGLSDDTLDIRPGLPDLMRWLVLSWMRDLPEGAIDWANARVLDKQAMLEIVAGGEGIRGQPYRLPVAQLQALNTRSVGENPARLNQVTEGWIGNSTWDKAQPVLTFIAPGKLTPLKIGTKVSAEVVFLMNIAYETVDGTRRLAPLFALHRLEPFSVPEGLAMKRLTVVFIGLLAVMLVLLVFLVRRDQRRTAALQKQLVEARRQRERRSASSPA